MTPQRHFEINWPLEPSSCKKRQKQSPNQETGYQIDPKLLTYQNPKCGQIVFEVKFT